MEIVWTDYVKYRAHLRGFDLAKIEHIGRHSSERYQDVSTHRYVAVGKHDNVLVMVPYEIKEHHLVPVTVHATTRQQINFRLRAGRFRHE